ncbi:MAG: UDP-N-acetylmuramate--L-alanine ligase [Clostridia bacterium]
MKIEKKFKNLHFIGIGGISMSALAMYCARLGIGVDGSDIDINRETRMLQNNGVEVNIPHCEENIPLKCSACVYTSAIAEDNVELVTAKKRNIFRLRRERLLGYIFNDFPTRIAIAGSHGKTSTTNLLAHTLKQCGLSPTAFVGANVGKTGGYIEGERDIVIAEACEYKGSFLYLKPTISILLNAELDHTDYYKSIDDIDATYQKFLNRTSPYGLSIICGDAVNKRVYKGIKSPVVTYGLSAKNDYVLSKITETNGFYEGDIWKDELFLTHIKSGIVGRNSLLNAVSVYIACAKLGVSSDKTIQAIATFTGTSRRWETRACPLCNVVLDYAHHPTQVKELIYTAKELKYSRIFAVFEPHTYSRTRDFLDRFAQSFVGVDTAIILPIYAAREKPIDGINHYLLADKTAELGTKTLCFSDYLETASWLKNTVRQDDLVLIIGAGNIYKLADLLS